MMYVTMKSKSVIAFRSAEASVHVFACQNQWNCSGHSLWCILWVMISNANTVYLKDT